jgi:hypothetical protein
MQVLEKLSKFNKVTLMWIPEHQGIPGNEGADMLAKEGIIEVQPNQSAALPFSVVRNLIKNKWNRGTGQGTVLYWLPTIQS